MSPTLKSLGFTLSHSTAATRHGASERSIQGPITTAPAAWHQDRRPLGWPARIGCDSTTLACLSYHAWTRWRKPLRRKRKATGPEGVGSVGSEGSVLTYSKF